VRRQVPAFTPPCSGEVEETQPAGPESEEIVTFPPDAYAEDGVDVTLIRWMLSLTPRERLEHCTAAANSLEELIERARANRTHPDP
jgi:hypothetical protein